MKMNQLYFEKINFNSEKSFMFNGKFPPECQKQSVPVILKCLISSILNGSNIKDHNSNESLSCLTISQIILFVKKIVIVLYKSTFITIRTITALIYRNELPQTN